MKHIENNLHFYFYSNENGETHSSQQILCCTLYLYIIGNKKLYCLLEYNITLSFVADKEIMETHNQTSENHLVLFANLECPTWATEDKLIAENVSFTLTVFLYAL